jgi:ABC-type uncharacterized transport system involved in gliding motility auxiliary subunit
MKFLPAILGSLSILAACGAILASTFVQNPYLMNGLWISSLVFLLFLAWLQREPLLGFLVHKKTRKGANLGFVIALVLGILVGINVIGKKYSWKKDLTRMGLNTLSPQTVKVLSGLNKEVKVYYFSSAQEKERNEPLIKNYARESKFFQYEFVDMVRRPTFVQSMGVKRNETVALVLGNKKELIDGVTEEKLTNGLIKLLREGELNVYFTVGHGEKSLVANPDEPVNYASLKDELARQGYQVKELNLFAEGKIPQDAGVVVVGGPAKAFFPKELEVLFQWVKSGGRVLFALDVDPQESGLSKGSKQIAESLKSFGLEFPATMLVDPTSRAANMEAQVLLGFSGSKEHPITKNFPASSNAAIFFFPLTTHILSKPVEGIISTPLAITSQNAWAESDWASLKTGSVTFQPERDNRGVMNLAMAIEGEKKENSKRIRFVVFGTSTFAASGLLDKVANRDLFFNTLNWLTDEEQFISIRPKDQNEGLKQFDNNILNLILLITIFVMPILIIAAGIVVWIRRSKL